MCSFATTAYTEKLHSKHFLTLKMSLSFDFKSLIFILKSSFALHGFYTVCNSYINHTFLHFFTVKTAIYSRCLEAECQG